MHLAPWHYWSLPCLMLLFLDVTQVVTYDARLKGTLPTFSVGTPSAYPSWFQSDQCPILFFALWPPAVVGPEPTHNVASPLRRHLTQSNNFPTLMWTSVHSNVGRVHCVLPIVAGPSNLAFGCEELSPDSFTPSVLITLTTHFVCSN